MACGEKSKSNVEIGNETGVIYINNGSEPQTLDPHVSTGSPEHNISMNIYEGLVTKHPKTLEPVPGVAENWVLSENDTVYTFNLRKNARWSNGDPVIANDFVVSWQRALMPSLANQYAYMMYYIKNSEAFHTGKITDFSKVGVVAKDDHTLVVTLDKPTHFFLQLLDHNSYFPVHISTLKKHGALDDLSSRWYLPENFVGNGAFVPTKWVVNSEIRLKKNEYYWDAKNVELNGAVIYPIEDQQAEERAFRTGQVHATNTPQMDIEKIAEYKNNQPDNIRIAQNYSSYFYIFNTTRKPLDNPKVRKALSMAVDRELLVERVTKGGEVAAYSLIPPDAEGYTPTAVLKYDVSKAQALLAEAGYPNGEGFPTFSILFNTHDNHRKVALAIQQMLKKNLNIDVLLDNKEWKVYIDSQHSKDYDISRLGWLADYLDPTNFFDLFISWSGNNRTGWVNAEYDRLNTEVRNTTDRQKRFEIFEKLDTILLEEMPYIPLYYYVDLNFVLPSVQGWHNNLMHYHPLKYVSLSN